MGVNLTPIILRKPMNLESLRGMSFAVDANQMLYQFLALIRKPDGTFFTDPRGNVTSHLIGFAFRVTRLMCEYDMKFIFVFDGKPVLLKLNELYERRLRREKAMAEWRIALKEGRLAEAFSKAVSSTRLTSKMVEDTKILLRLMGLPFIEAPSDAEAQAAFIVQKGDAYAVAGRDYDTLLYGSPRLVRNLAIRSTEFLPSKGYSKVLKPELIETEESLRKLGITREQLVDIAILIGTDFNEGVEGIGPKKALRLIKKYGRIEDIPEDIVEPPENYEDVRRIFLNPEVEEKYNINYTGLDEERLIEFLYSEKRFSKKRVIKLIERLRRFYSSIGKDTGLKRWLP
ncbi:MAG: flap endonuclease-1 [Crenarchaeota archaeon]|nr:flap endonuclease-1 [Thermoproteota archaeon]MDW8034612.1 flap endonuclease-1 [Nitrososphaerota archaeon]